MAYTARDFHRDLAIFSAGGILGPTRSRKLMAYAARKGIQLAGLAAARAPPVVAAHPVAAGVALGAGALATPPGQDLLAAAAEHGRQSRILFERAQQELMVTPQRLEAALTSQPVSVETVVPRIRKRAVSKFNKAVGAGMKVVKKAKTYGGKGKIKPGKKAFTMVTKLASAKKKGRKAPKSGLRRSIWNAMKGLR
jgi:hypothetical protein